MKTNKMNMWNCSLIGISDELERIHFQDSDARWNFGAGEPIRGRQNGELGVWVQRNKLTRTLGFDKKAFYKQELKKKRKKKIFWQERHSEIRIWKTRPTACSHRSDISSRRAGVRWVRRCLHKHLPLLGTCQHRRTRHRQGYRNTATQFPPRRVSHWRTAGDDADYSSSKMPMTE